MKPTAIPRPLRSSDEARDGLARASAVEVPGPWTAHQALVHCAQSIEYSMRGYPRARSRLFQRTIGRIALRKFLRAGVMSHDTRAEIPGADALPDGPLDQGIARLRRAFEAFRSFTGPLAPHFAYGEVTRGEYDQLHAMHLADHLSRFQVTSPT